MMKIRTTGESVQRAYPMHWNTANCLFDLSQERREGSTLLRGAAVTYAAFTIEAFLSHVFDELNPGMNEQVVWKKLRAVTSRLNINLDFQCRPYQTIQDLLNTRNMAAHGRDHSIEFDFVADEMVEFVPDSGPGYSIDVADEASVQTVMDDVKTVIEDILVRMGKSPFDMNILGRGSMWQSVEGSQN